MSASNDAPLSTADLAWLEACPSGSARTVGQHTVDRRSTDPSEPSAAESLALIAKQDETISVLRRLLVDEKATSNGYRTEAGRLQRQIAGASELAENLRTRHSSQIRGLCEQIASRDATIETLSKQLAHLMR